MSKARTAGTVYGLVGMLSFSLTLPATRAAVLHLHPEVVAFGRPVLAAVCAAVLLLVTRQPFPARAYWKNFGLVVLGLVIGVPLTFAFGMRDLPSAHGAITLALLPLATALVAALRAGERPSRRFWAASLVGSLTVLAFAEMSGAGRIQPADIILLLSVAASAVGYAEGARLARVMPGWQVISWALVIGLPLQLVPFVLAVRAHGLAAPLSAWSGFAYIAIVSNWAGFFAWFKGLSTGGISRVGQLQLIQPFCTLLFSALLLGETITVAMVVAAVIVVAAVAVGWSAPLEIRHQPLEAGEPSLDEGEM
ncbi:MAG TPA: DMT family transporter [Terriglobales bacterium]|nr:DMT family transporter [Terriglobales bacterium]